MTGRRGGKVKDVQSSLSLPEEVRKPCAVITVVGQKEITVEGHGGMITYGTDCICIKTGKQKLVIEGCNLVVDYYHNEEVKVIGCIRGIRWEDS